tara:strand:+ start:111 stop:653 length:543 start_codon:yes stop_codon:yes gene_type:complete
MDIKIGIEMLMNRLLKKKKPSLTERLDRQVTSTIKIDEKTKDAPIDHSYFNFNSTENTQVGNNDILPSNVIPLKTRKLSRGQDEKERVRKIAKQIANNFEKTADNAGCFAVYPYYFLLFYIQQQMIFSLPYYSYRNAVALVERQVIRNHKKFLEENCPELSEENSTITKDKKKEKDKTIH